MPINHVTTIVCDCCGFSFAEGTQAYATVSTMSITYAMTSKVYCTTKGCATEMLGHVTNQVAVEAGTHTSLIVGGVIPQHPTA